MADAARSPVGASQVTRTTKVRDLLIVIVIPFAIPAAVLPMANGVSSLTLPNLAFGFVAVAFAGVARAITSKTDEWLTYVLGALTSVALQTALAVVGDTSKVNAHLNDLVLTAPKQFDPSITQSIREAALAVSSAQPGAFHWVCSVLLGVALMVLSFELIRRER